MQCDAGTKQGTKAPEPVLLGLTLPRERGHSNRAVRHNSPESSGPGEGRHGVVLGVP